MNDLDFQVAMDEDEHDRVRFGSTVMWCYLILHVMLIMGV